MLVFVAGLVATTFHASSVNAQARPGALPAAFMADSVAWQRILVYVVSFLSTHLVWSIARTEGVLHGDRVGCPSPPR